MCYDQDAELSTSSALVAEARFIGSGVSQILVGTKKHFWPGLARVGLRSLGGVLFWYKCLGPINTFIKDETMRLVPVLEFIKKRDPFIHLKMGAWDPTLDFSIGQQATAAVRPIGVPSIPKKKVQQGKGKEVAPMK